MFITYISFRTEIQRNPIYLRVRLGWIGLYLVILDKHLFLSIYDLAPLSEASANDCGLFLIYLFVGNT